MRLATWAAALGIGVTVTLLLRIFEYIGIEGTAWLWEDLFNSDTDRWLVLVLGAGLGLVLSVVVRLLRQPRLPPISADLMEEVQNPPPATLQTLGVILAVGATSLLAGASLGPEAALMASSVVIGSWAADKAGLADERNLLVLSAVGALLVAFLHSPVMIVVPLLLMLQKKQLRALPAAVAVFTGLVAYGTLWLTDLVLGESLHPTLPPLPASRTTDYVVAVVLGFVATFLALLLNWLITWFHELALLLDRVLGWVLSAVLFGLVLGGIYFFGGQSVQFSGSLGTHLLAADQASYGLLALLGLVVAKLLATSWSAGTGYRGGLVFPSLYMGLAVGLMVGRINPDWAGPGAVFGALAGILSAVTASPIVAAVFMLAIVPLAEFPLSLAAILGSVLGMLLLKRLRPRKAVPVPRPELPRDRPAT